MWYVSQTRAEVYPWLHRTSAMGTSVGSSPCQPRKGKVYRPVNSAVRVGRVGRPSL